MRVCVLSLPTSHLQTIHSSPPQVSIMCSMLKQMNVIPGQVTIARHGQEAVDRVKDRAADNPYGLILMDVQMPGMDGYEATTVIRAHEAEHKVKRAPIFACTANAFAEDNRRCIDCGCWGVLNKPIRKKDLERVVLKYILPIQPGAGSST